MRGEDIQQHDLFSYGSLEERVPADHPLRPIRSMVDEALKALDGRFDEIYDADGRKSIPPERLLRALLLQMLYTVRSERMLMEQLEYNLLFRWFVGLSANEPVWHPTVFTQEPRPAAGRRGGRGVLLPGRESGAAEAAIEDDHFTVDGTLIEAWAGQKSFQAKKDDQTSKLPPPQDAGSNPTRQLPEREAVERNARVPDGPLCAAVQEDARSGSQAVLSGASGDGKPQWFGGGYTSDAGDGNGGAGRRHRDRRSR